MSKKLFEIWDLKEIIASRKKLGLKVGLVQGSFDIFHLGHFKLLKLASTNVDILVVGVESDKSVRVYQKLFNEVSTREELVGSLSFVDYTFIKTREYLSDGQKDIYDELKPDIFIYGKDFFLDDSTLRKLVSKHGIELLKLSINNTERITKNSIQEKIFNEIMSLE